MFIYFSRLYEKHRSKILPIAVFSYDQVRDEPDTYMQRFTFLDVLRFHFYKLELKKLSWREYIHRDNPVAAALLSKRPSWNCCGPSPGKVGGSVALLDQGRWLVSVEASNGHCRYHHAEAAIRINRHGACAKGPPGRT